MILQVAVHSLPTPVSSGGLAPGGDGEIYPGADRSDATQTAEMYNAEFADG